MNESEKWIDPWRLFHYLDDRGIDQAWLADRLGISQQYLTHIKVRRKPVPDWLPERTSEILGIAPDLLFDNLPSGQTNNHASTEVGE